MSVKAKNEIKLGKKIDLKKKEGIQLKLINKNDEDLEIEMISVIPNPIFKPFLPGYERTRNPGFITTKPVKFKLKGNTIKLIKLYVQIPDEEKYYGKKYVFMIKAMVVGAVPVEIYSKVYITTLQKEKDGEEEK
jgi:hypothetical protein